MQESAKIQDFKGPPEIIQDKAAYEKTGSCSLKTNFYNFP